MKFWDKVTGRDMTREFKAFEGRVIELPSDYQMAWEEIKENMWQYSDFSGRNLMCVFDSVLTMFEETAAQGLSVQEVLGNDVNEFCSMLMEADKPDSYRDKWRRKLNNNIQKKLSRVR